MGERPGFMASASARCHMASSYIHASQVTRNVVSDDHDLYQCAVVTIFLSRDVNPIRPHCHQDHRVPVLGYPQPKKHITTPRVQDTRRVVKSVGTTMY